MQPDSYYLSLYPLQDAVLAKIAEIDQSFYLTGGTALRCCYLNHRYSDDLDFFVNRDAEFSTKVQGIIDHFRTQSNWAIEVEKKDTDFARCFVTQDQVQLKLDFVNDVTYRYGEPQQHPIFSRVDNLRNILSNKVSALSRNASKDFVHIIFVCRTLSFNWREIIHEASEKDMWVNPVEISRLIYEYEVVRLTEIPWIEPVNVERFQRETKIVAKEILLGSDHGAGY